MSCIPSLLLIIFTLVSVIEGKKRRFPIVIPSISVEDGYIVGYVFAAIFGLIILLGLICWCIGLVNEPRQRVGQQPETGATPPHPNRQANHRDQDPFYTAGSAFLPPLDQSTSPTQPQELSPQNDLSPLSVNPLGQNEVDSVATQPSSQANEAVRGQNGELPPLKPLRPTASAHSTNHDV